MGSHSGGGTTVSHIIKIFGDEEEDLRCSGSAVSVAGSKFTADAIYAHESDMQDVCDRSFAPLIKRLVKGYSISIIACGATGAEKKASVEELVHLLVRSLYQSLDQDGGMRQRGKNSSGYSCQLKFSSFEIVDEVIQDLLNGTNSDLDVVHDVKEGIVVDRCTRRNQGELDDFLEALEDSFKARTTQMFEFGPAARYAHTFWQIELLQRNPYEGVKTLKSKLIVVETAGTEQLAVDPATLRTEEGPTLNKSLLALRTIGESLDSPDTAPFTPFTISKLTNLLRDAVGGNSITTFISLVRQGQPEASIETLSLGDLFRLKATFPIPLDDCAQGLLSNFRRDLLRLENESENGRGLSNGNAADEQELLLKLNELEGRVVKDNLEKLKAKEEKERIYEKLLEFKTKYNELVEQKAQMQTSLINGEDEKLKISKALLDLKIENNQLKESSEAEKYELVTKLLHAENTIMQLELKEENRDKNALQLGKDLEERSRTLQEREQDLRILKENYKKLNDLYKAELGKNEELGVELLTLVNQKSKLTEEASQLQKEREALSLQSGDLDVKCSTLVSENKQLEESLRICKVKVDEIQAEKLKLELQLERNRVEFENKRLDLEKATADHARDRDAEVSNLKKAQESELKQLQQKNLVLEEQVSELEVKSRSYSREISELSTRLSDTKEQLTALTASNAALEEKMSGVTASFRQKLVALLNPPESKAEPGSQEQAKIQRELYDSFQTKEKELEAKLGELRKANHKLVQRSRDFQEQYRQLKYKLEDVDPKSAGEMQDDTILSKQETSDIEAELQREIATIKQRTEQVQRDFQGAQEKNMSLIEQHRKAIKEHQERCAELESELKMMEKQNRNLEAENQALSKRGVSGMAGAQTAQQLQELQETLSQQIAKLNSSPAVSTAAVSHLERENEQLRHKLSRLESASGPATSSEDSRELERLRNENQRLRRRSVKEGAQDSRRVADLLTRCTVAEEELKSYKAQMKELIADYEKKIQRLKSRIR